jgi:hypothetical protein
MKAWSDALRAVLDRREHTVTVFFRDDDGGWADPQLHDLVELFAAEDVPLDLALIPSAVEPPLVDWLLGRVGPGLGLHQHGYCHVSHERVGRRCEFGGARGYRQQYEDLARGQGRLKILFGRSLDPIFTPPWNRCTADTAVALHRLGFRALSRDATATPLPAHAGLRELPVTLDWMRHRHGDQPDLATLADRLAMQLQSDRPVGIMLHHAVMGAADLHALQSLLALLRGHLVVDCVPMRELLDADKGCRFAAPTRAPRGAGDGRRGGAIARPLAEPRP